MDNKPQGPICQSCAMPLQNEDDKGTNTDNSKNKDYCKFCYKNGEFIEPDITMEQKIDTVVEIATTKMGMPEEQAKKLAQSIIPNLKRWNK